MKNRKNEKKKEDRQIVEAFVMVLQFGIYMMVPIGMCVAAGVWIGNKTGAVWMVVPLFFVGALAGGTNIYKMSKKLLRSEEDAGEVNTSYYRQLDELSVKRRAAEKDDQDVKKNQ